MTEKKSLQLQIQIIYIFFLEVHVARYMIMAFHSKLSRDYIVYEEAFGKSSFRGELVDASFRIC